MSLRRKAFVAALTAGVGFAANAILAIYVDQRFLWFAVVFLAGYGIYGFTLRCKNCGEFMGRRKVRLLGMEFTYWGGITIPKKCSRCGNKF